MCIRDSGRPASLQYDVKTNFNKEKKLSDLYSSEVSQLLATLRNQIEIAQNKND